MADEAQEAGSTGAEEASPCMPCRGTGKVVSTLGGTAGDVDCPWCEGTGTFIAEHDAQARWRDEADTGATAPPDAET
jgi:DnaJ-class molecular chaperone